MPRHRALWMSWMLMLVTTGCGASVEWAEPAPPGAAFPQSRPTESPPATAQAPRCPIGRANCSGRPEDGCNVDLRSDAAHCGVCGHGCQGGTCAGGACQPWRLAALSKPDLVEIAVSDTHVYWTQPSDGVVLRVAKSGGSSELVGAGRAPSALLADETGAYWRSGALGDLVHEVYFYDASTHSSALVTRRYVGYVAGMSGKSMAIDDSGLYWVNYGTAKPNVARIPAGTLSPAIVVDLLDGDPSSRAGVITTSGGDVYWTHRSQVQKTPAGGGATTTVADLSSAYGHAEALTSHGDMIYFIGVDHHVNPYGLYAEPTRTGGTGFSRSVRMSVPAVAADASGVYFPDGGTLIARSPGGVERDLAYSVGPIALALDDKSVYFATSNGIWKVAK